MRPGRLPTVGRAFGEPLLSWLVAYGSEAGAAGHPGVSPWPPAAARDNWEPEKMQPPARMLSLHLGLVVPDLWVVLAKPLILLEDSSMAAQGHLILHKGSCCHKLSHMGWGWLERW